MSDWRSDLNSDDKEKTARAWVKLEEDTTLFANFFFQDPFDGEKSFVPFAWQDAVFQDENNRVLMCTSRQIGKTTAAALKALHYAYFHKNCLVLVASQTFAQALEFMEKTKTLMKLSTKIKWEPLQVDAKEGKAVIKLRNPHTKGIPDTYSRILAVVSSSARGYSPNLVIPDELAFWNDAEKTFNDVIEPTIFGTGGSIWALSTPNGAQGIFYKLFNDSYWNAYQFDWRANPRKTEEAMKPLRARLSRSEFDSYYEAKFVSPKDAYFTRTEIDRATSGFEWKMPSGITAIGVDLGKHVDPTIIIVGCLDNYEGDRETATVRVTDVIVKPLETKYSSIVGEIRALNLKYKPSIICIDATGVGQGPVETLESEGLPVEPVMFSIQKKALVYGALKKLMEDPVGRIKIPDDSNLVNQLGWMMYEYLEGGKIKIYAPEGSKDDMVDSLSLLAYGLTNFMSAPASLEFVEKPLAVKKPESHAGKTLIYCSIHDDYHWGECESPFINT